MWWGHHKISTTMQKQSKTEPFSCIPDLDLVSVAETGNLHYLYLATSPFRSGYISQRKHCSLHLLQRHLPFEYQARGLFNDQGVTNDFLLHQVPPRRDCSGRIEIAPSKSYVGTILYYVCSVFTSGEPRSLCIRYRGARVGICDFQPRSQRQVLSLFLLMKR